MSNGMQRTDYGYVSHTEQRIIEELSREERKIQAIVYTRRGCQKCRHTILKLKEVMPVQAVNADDRDIERFRKQGFQSLPVVTIYKANGTRDQWSDLRMDKLKEYTKR